MKGGFNVSIVLVAFALNIYTTKFEQEKISKYFRAVINSLYKQALNLRYIKSLYSFFRTCFEWEALNSGWFKRAINKLFHFACSVYTRPLRFIFDDVEGAIRKSWPTQVLDDCKEILSVQVKLLSSSVPADPLSSATNPVPWTLEISTCCARSPKQSARTLHKCDLKKQHTATRSITLNITTMAITGPLRTLSVSATGFSAQGEDVEMHFPLQQNSSRLPGEPQCSSLVHDWLQDRRQ